MYLHFTTLQTNSFMPILEIFKNFNWSMYKNLIAIKKCMYVLLNSLLTAIATMVQLCMPTKDFRAATRKAGTALMPSSRKSYVM